jgi:excisionase family DNA binding protein
MERLLRAAEVAQVLNLRPATVYALAHRGVIPHVRLAQGGRRALIRFRAEDLEEFIRTRSIRAGCETT